MQKERVKIPMFALHENNLQSIKKLSERDTVVIYNHNHVTIATNEETFKGIKQVINCITSLRPIKL